MTDPLTRRPIPALTLHRPWPTLIFYSGKDVENRSWWTSHRGPLLIHAGKAWARYALDFADGIACDTGAHVCFSTDPDDHETGIVGIVDVVSVVKESPSPWAMDDQWHWVLANPRVFPDAIPCSGRQQLWTPAAEVQAEVDRVLAQLGDPRAVGGCR